MIINKTVNDSEKEIVLSLQGRIDTTTAPKFEEEIKNLPQELELLRLDFSGVEYISSAGLRVLLLAQKTMNKQGKMIINNVGETIKDLFELTGFIDILTIE